MTSERLSTHIACSRELFNGARLAILSGDPGRVPILAKLIDPEAREIAHHRGYLTYLANFRTTQADIPVVVTTSGIGGPSISIVIEELAQLGIQQLLRIGTTGAIQPHIQLGDIIIPTGAVRLEGASEDFAPLAYPAVPDYRMLNALEQAAEGLHDRSTHLGIIATTSTFYPGQERYDTHREYVLRRLQHSLTEWQQLGVLSYEMECATLFTMASALGLQSAAYLIVAANRTQSEAVCAQGLHANARFFAESVLLGFLKNITRHRDPP
jgi:uridine phosphorylase